jgi:photosynthetic reaction center cytochrome c subunit
MSFTQNPSGPLLMLAGAALLAGCERPPVDVGAARLPRHRHGAGLQPAHAGAQIPANQVPEPAPAASSDGPKAKEIYQNVQVLGD